MDDQAILARRPGSMERTFRWASRHRELVATAAAILFLALTIGTAAIWAQARKTRAVTSILHTYINQTYPLVDFNTVEAMAQATNSLSGPIDEATREERLRFSSERSISTIWPANFHLSTWSRGQSSPGPSTALAFRGPS